MQCLSKLQHCVHVSRHGLQDGAEALLQQAREQASRQVCVQRDTDKVGMFTSSRSILSVHLR